MAAASIEIVIRARDEASAVVAQTMKKIVTETETVRRAQQSAAGGAGAGALSTVGGALQMGAKDPRLRAIGQGIQEAEQLFTRYAGAVSEATKQQLDFNEALRGTSAAPFVQQMRDANRVIDEYAENAKTLSGQALNLWNNLYVRPSARPINKAEAARARAEQEAEIRNEAEGLQQLRQTEMQRAIAKEGTLEAQRRAALQAGDAAAAEAAKKQIDDLADYRLQKAQESLAREQEVRAAAHTQHGGKVPEAVQKDFAEQQALLIDRATQERAERNQRSAQQERQLAEELASKRHQNAIQEIADARAVEVAQVESTARILAADAERRHDYRGALQAQLDGIAQVRAAEIQAIQESASARAQAAKGPTREEDILAIRREEAAKIVQLNIATAEQVTQAWQRSAEARKQHERDVRAATQALQDAQRALYADATKGLPGLQADIAKAQATQLPKAPLQEAGEWLANVRAQSAMKPGAFMPGRAGQLLDLEGEAAAIARLAKEQEVADERVMRERLREQERLARERVAELTPTGAAGAQIAGAAGALKVTRDAAGNVTIANQFEQAAVTAGKLTDKVKELGGALKDLQVSPGFAAKLSQDLADTLTFLGARSP